MGRNYDNRAGQVDRPARRYSLAAVRRNGLTHAIANSWRELLQNHPRCKRSEVASELRAFRAAGDPRQVGDIWLATINRSKLEALV